MDQQRQSRWPTGWQLLWTSAAVVLLTSSILVGYRYDITLWEWLKLLIVPVVIAGGGLWFNRQQRERELEIARQQREREVEIAERRTQDEALQAYLDGMSQLLTDKERPLHTAQVGDSLSTVARARTLTVLTRLDGKRKGTVLQFFYESSLVANKDHPILDLRGADLSGVQLSYALLDKIVLTGADLRGADLRGSDLRGADLGYANLNRAKLPFADLTEADLSVAHLRNTDLSQTYLINANLSNVNAASDPTAAMPVGANPREPTGTDLSRANLAEANLSGAFLAGAKLDSAEVSQEQLEQAAFLEGATMPNGQKYQDWLKDREGRKEDRENDPPQPEVDRSKPRRWQMVLSFLRGFTRNKDTYSPFSRLLVKALLPTYVFGTFLVLTVASIGEYSIHHPEDAALYLPPGAFLLVAWGFGIYAGSRDGSWEHFRWFFPCVALVMALGVTFWVTYVSIVDQELPIDQLWTLTLRKILVRLKVFLSTYFVCIFGALFARALARLAEEPRIDGHSRRERFQPSLPSLAGLCRHDHYGARQRIGGSSYLESLSELPKAAETVEQQPEG